MMKRFLTAFILLLAINTPDSLFAWGKRGHDAIAYIAELNLKPETKAIVESYIDGRSIVYYASWPDQIRFIHEYSLVYAKFPHRAVYSSDLKASGRDGKVEDGLQLINMYMETMGNGKYKDMPDSVVAVAIKALTHIVGDVHCPVHQRVDGRNESINITSGGEKQRFHHFWDVMPSTAHDWGYLEYGHQLNRFSKEKIDEATAGSPFEWGEQNVIETLPVWEYVEAGGELGKPYINKVTPILDDLIAKAGYRLAYVLNYIFN